MEKIPRNSVRESSHRHAPEPNASRSRKSKREQRHRYKEHGSRYRPVRGQKEAPERKTGGGKRMTSITGQNCRRNFALGRQKSRSSGLYTGRVTRQTVPTRPSCRPDPTRPAALNIPRRRIIYRAFIYRPAARRRLKKCKNPVDRSPTVVLVLFLLQPASSRRSGTADGSSRVIRNR